MVGLLPLAGNALPFISAGGSNLISTLAAIGILLNISRQSGQGKSRRLGRKARNGGLTVRLLICAGGTGGGVYPALAVLNALRKEHTDMQLLWVGGEGGMEAVWWNARAFPSRASQPPGSTAWAAGPCRATSARLARACWLPGASCASSGPTCCSSPAAMWPSRWHWPAGGSPACSIVPDIEPGLALKTLARFADRIAVTARPRSVISSTRNGSS